MRQTLETEFCKKTASRAPTERMLIVLECIAEQGPISLTSLTEQTGTSRASIWRMISTLRTRGWIRMRPGDQKVELSYRIDNVFANANYSDEEFAPFFEAMSELSTANNIGLDLIGFDCNAQLSLLETMQRKKLGTPYRASLISDPVAIAIQIACTMPKIRQLVRHYAATAPRDEVWRIESGSHFAELKAIRCPVWDESEASVCVPVVGSKGSPAAMRISKRSTRTSPDDLMRVAREVHLMNKRILSASSDGTPEAFFDLCRRFPDFSE